MRISGTLFCALLLALLSGACAAPVATPLQVPRSWSTDEARILAAMQASAEAWNRGDLREHLAIYVDTVSCMTRTGPRPGVAAVEDAFTRTYFQNGRPKQNLRFEQLRVRPLGQDAALGTGRFILSGGSEQDQSGWFTLVWIRTVAGWRAVHDHSS